MSNVIPANILWIVSVALTLTVGYCDGMNAGYQNKYKQSHVARWTAEPANDKRMTNCFVQAFSVDKNKINMPVVGAINQHVV